MAVIGGTLTLAPTAGATVTLTINATMPRLLAQWTAGEAETVEISGTPSDNQELVCLLLNDGVVPRTITFGTGCAPSATVIGTVNKRAMVSFRAYGGTFYERARTLAL